MLVIKIYSFPRFQWFFFKLHARINIGLANRDVGDVSTTPDDKVHG